MLSKVKSVQSTGSFPNEYGAVQDNPDLPKHGEKLLYKFEYEFEDGTILTANHKTTTSPFPQGTEVDYEVTKTHPEHGKSGKVKKPDTGQYSGSNNSYSKEDESVKALRIARQSSLNRAVEICIYNSSQATAPELQIVSPEFVMELAGKLTAWVMAKEAAAEPTQTPTQAVESSTIGQPPVIEEENDDLPF